jgi:hypothetical protein
MVCVDLKQPKFPNLTSNLILLKASVRLFGTLVGTHRHVRYYPTLRGTLAIQGGRSVVGLGTVASRFETEIHRVDGAAAVGGAGAARGDARRHRDDRVRPLGAPAGLDRRSDDRIAESRSGMQENDLLGTGNVSVEVAQFDGAGRCGDGEC